MHTTPSELKRPDAKPGRRKRLSSWLKRLGIAGFLFFLFKGLAWLVFGAAMARYMGCRD